MEGIAWDSSEAHSAAYDAQRTAELFCAICNRMRSVFELATQPLGHSESGQITPTRCDP